MLEIHCGYSSVVERLLAKEKVAGSNPVARSNKRSQHRWGFLFWLSEETKLERMTFYPAWS